MIKHLVLVQESPGPSIHRRDQVPSTRSQGVREQLTVLPMGVDVFCQIISFLFLKLLFANTLFLNQNLYFMSDHFDVVDRVLVLIVGTELELNFKTSPRVPCLVLGPPLVAAVCRAGVVSSEANCVNLP